MSAISHKVNTENHLVNDYLWGSTIPVPAQVHPDTFTPATLNPYFNPTPIMDQHNITNTVTNLSNH